MATHSSILAWRILWTEEPGGLLSIRLRRVGHNWSDLAYMHALEKEMATHSCSCLENPRDGGACWAAVYGVAQSWTRLKWLSSSSKGGVNDERNQRKLEEVIFKDSWGNSNNAPGWQVMKEILRGEVGGVAWIIGGLQAAWYRWSSRILTKKVCWSHVMKGLTSQSKEVKVCWVSN